MKRLESSSVFIGHPMQIKLQRLRMKNMDKTKFYTTHINPKGHATMKRTSTSRWATTKKQKTTALLVFPAGDAGNEVHLRSRNPLALGPELVSKEEEEEEWDWQVIGDEAGGVPVTIEEDAPVCEEDDDNGPHQTPPSGVWHELAVPWEVLWIDPLRLHSLSESNARDTDTEPVEHPRDGGHVGEPAENGVRGLGDGHV